MLASWKGDSVLCGTLAASHSLLCHISLQDPGPCPWLSQSTAGAQPPAVPGCGSCTGNRLLVGTSVRNGVLHSFSLCRVPPQSLGFEVGCQDLQRTIGNSQGCVCALGLRGGRADPGGSVPVPSDPRTLELAMPLVLILLPALRCSHRVICG